MDDKEIICYKTKNNEIFVKYYTYLTQTIVDDLFHTLTKETYSDSGSMKFVFHYNNCLKLNSINNITFKPNKELLLCNPLYDIDPNSRKKVIKDTFEENHFKNINKFTVNKFSKIICINDISCKCRNKQFNKRYYPVGINILSFISDKLNFHKLLDGFGMLDYHPKTYINLIPNIKTDKNFFLKIANRDAQRGIFIGKLDYLSKIAPKSRFFPLINNINLNNFIIQESLNNCLEYEKGRRIVFGMWFYFTSEYYYIYDKTTEISVDKTSDHRIDMTYNLVKDKDIKDHTLILKNMVDVCDNFLKRLLLFFKFKNTKINKNQFSLCRMDFLVEKETYKPYILEINFNIDLNGKESFKDKVFCDYIVKNKLMNFLYS